MACMTCEHCSGKVYHDEITLKNGFSYHKKCHKCYVCSETNLNNAEVFKGVIFCSGCAKRIFQGCFTAKKTRRNSRTFRSRSKSRKRQVPARPPSPKPNVIELAERIAAGADTDVQTASDDSKKYKMDSTVVMSTEVAYPVRNENVQNKPSNLKSLSMEIGTTTTVTQELLKLINCPIISQNKQHVSTKPTVKKRCGRKRCRHRVGSDPRVAELGQSTEIATMILRKKSETPLTIRSNFNMKTENILSLPNLSQDSDIESEDDGKSTDCLESTLETLSESSHLFDGGIKKILKMPIDYFRRHIITRSSLVEVIGDIDNLAGDDSAYRQFRQRLRNVFFNEITEHRGHGVRRLYSTINRRKTPYKLGWLNLVKTASQVLRKKHRTQPILCRHYRASHSYRCMRSQVMRLAGPTKSECRTLLNAVEHRTLQSEARNFSETSQKGYNTKSFEEYDFEQM